MAEFTKEQLIARAKLKINSLRGAVTQSAFTEIRSGLEVDLRLTEIALEALTAVQEQEPLYQVLNSGGWRDVRGDIFEALKAEGLTTRILYAAPQLPQPAVVDKNGLLPCPFCGDIACVVDNRLGFYVKCSDDDCDAVAIGPRVPELQSEQEERSIDWRALEQSAKDKWNRRAAMLQGTHRDLSYPVDPQVAEYEKIMQRAVPDGWVMVPVEPTEEMNKAGWAAMNEHDAINPTYRAMLAAAPQQEADNG